MHRKFFMTITNIDQVFNMLHNTSSSVQSFGKTNGVTNEQMATQAQALNAKANADLAQKQIDELLNPDGTSTLGRPGDPSTQIIRRLPAREIVVFPQHNFKNEHCLSQSWWTRYMAPVPKFEKFSEKLYSSNKNVGQSANDAQKPDSVPNFPIHFDRMLGYRKFLS